MIEKILRYMFFCHRLPERSFFINGKQFPICSRCTGILVGYFIGLALIIYGIKINLLYISILMVPLLIDGTGQYFGKWISNNKRRFITGILAGISTMFIFKAILFLGYNHGNAIRNTIGR